MGLPECYSENVNNSRIAGGGIMKGYIVGDGYMGFVDGRYILFASEEDYRDYLEN